MICTLRRNGFSTKLMAGRYGWHESRASKRSWKSFASRWPEVLRSSCCWMVEWKRTRQRFGVDTRRNNIIITIIIIVIIITMIMVVDRRRRHHHHSSSLSSSPSSSSSSSSSSWPSTVPAPRVRSSFCRYSPAARSFVRPGRSRDPCPWKQISDQRNESVLLEVDSGLVASAITTLTMLQPSVLFGRPTRQPSTVLNATVKSREITSFLSQWLLNTLKPDCRVAIQPSCVTNSVRRTITAVYIAGPLWNPLSQWGHPV